MMKRLTSMYPGEILFALAWAWETRREGGQKSFLERMLNAVEDANERAF